MRILVPVSALFDLALLIVAGFAIEHYYSCRDSFSLGVLVGIVATIRYNHK